MAVTTPLFAQHSRSWETHRYVYPVISRRSRGLSIGINLNPDRRCNFDCVYCSVDRRGAAPEGEVELGLLEQELERLVGLAASGEIWTRGAFAATPSQLRRVNDVAFSGDGEPTSSPHFPAACRLAAAALERHGLRETKIVVITNATLLDRPAVGEALAFLADHAGEVWAKLDSGTEEQHRRLNRSRVSLDRIVENLALVGQRHPLVIQSMFLEQAGQGPSEAELSAYLARLEGLKASGCRVGRVQVYTVARATAEQSVRPLPFAELEQIAGRIRALGLPVETFGAR